MALLIYSIIRRYMKETGRYFEPGSQQPPRLHGLLPGESLIGWYRNPEPWTECALVFTDRAIYSVDGDATTRLGIDEILGYETPSKTKNVDGVMVRTRDGSHFLRISGSHQAVGRAAGLQRVPEAVRTALKSDFLDAFSLVQVLFALKRKP